MMSRNGSSRRGRPPRKRRPPAGEGNEPQIHRRARSLERALGVLGRASRRECGRAPPRSAHVVRDGGSSDPGVGSTTCFQRGDVSRKGTRASERVAQFPAEILIGHPHGGEGTSAAKRDRALAHTNVRRTDRLHRARHCGVEITRDCVRSEDLFQASSTTPFATRTGYVSGANACASHASARRHDGRRAAGKALAFA